MNRQTRYGGSRGLLTAAAGVFAALMAAACSSQPGSSLLAPSGLPGGSLAAMPGGDTCPAGDNVKVDAANENSVSYNASPDIITAVCIKAGQTDGLVITTNGSNGCYSVAGIGTTTATVTRVGSGRGCQGLSHVRFYFEEKVPPPPPPPPPCDPKTDPKCGTDG